LKDRAKFTPPLRGEILDRDRSIALPIESANEKWEMENDKWKMINEPGSSFRLFTTSATTQT
jgi:hypothetical protein